MKVEETKNSATGTMKTIKNAVIESKRSQLYDERKDLSFA